MAIPLLMSSGSTLHFSPDFRVAMMARTVELIKSGSRRKFRASVRCKKPPRTAKKSQHWHHRAKPAPTSGFPSTDASCGSRAQVLKHTTLYCHFTPTKPLGSSSACYRHVAKRKPYNHKLISMHKLLVIDSTSPQMADDKQLYKS